MSKNHRRALIAVILIICITGSALIFGIGDPLTIIEVGAGAILTTLGVVFVRGVAAGAAFGIAGVLLIPACEVGSDIAKNIHSKHIQELKSQSSESSSESN